MIAIWSGIPTRFLNAIETWLELGRRSSFCLIFLNFLLFWKVFALTIPTSNTDSSLFPQIFSRSSLLILLTSQTQKPTEKTTSYRDHYWLSTERPIDAQSAPTTPTKTRGREDRHGGKELLPGAFFDRAKRENGKKCHSVTALTAASQWEDEKAAVRRRLRSMLCRRSASFAYSKVDGSTRARELLWFLECSKNKVSCFGLWFHLYLKFNQRWIYENFILLKQENSIWDIKKYLFL